MAGGYSITISAVDKASGTFDALNKRVEAFNKRIALARAPFDRLQQSFTKFTRVTGLDKIATGFANVARAGTETFRSMVRIIEPLAAITGAASLAGIYKLATAWGAFGTQLGQQAVRAGVSVDQLQALQGAAVLAGVSADTLTQGVTGLKDNMRDAAFGGAPQFITALTALGLKYDDIKKMSPTDALKVLADKLTGIKDPTDRAKVAMDLFGGAGEALLPFLTKGSSGIDNLTDRAKLLGGQLGVDGVKAADDFRKSQDELAMAAEGFGRRLGAAVGPALTPLLRDFATWIATSPAVQAGLVHIADAAKEFADYLRGVDWAGVAASIKSIATTANTVAQALGGWTAVAVGVLSFIVGSWIAAMMVPFLTLTALFLKLPKDAAKAAVAANGELAKIKPGGMGMGWGAALAGIFGSTLNLAMNGGPNQNPDGTYKHFPGGGGTEDTPEYIKKREEERTQNDALPWYKRLFLPNHGLFGGGGGAAPYVPGVPSPVYPGPGTQGTGNERNVRNNNPTNLTFAGQPGATSDGRFARFPNMETGVAADLHQFLLYQDRDKKTSIEDMIHKATPASDNNPGVESYIDRVAKQMGMRRSNSPDLHKPEIATKFIMAVAPNEGGTPDIDAVRRGVGLRLGTPTDDRGRAVTAAAPSGAPVSAPSAAPAGTPGANGKVDMNVRVDGPAQVTTRSSGGVNVETRTVRQGFS